MSIFSRKKQHSESEEEQIPITNEVQMLFARFLFETEPVIDDVLIEEQLAQQFRNFENPQRGDSVSRLFFFTDYTIEFDKGTVHAQGTLFKAGQDATAKSLETAYRQKWHWPEMEQETSNCKFEIVLSDLLTRTMDYKVRLEVFQKYVNAVATALMPKAIYFPGSEKLVKTTEYLDDIKTEGFDSLYGFVNIRLFNAGENRMIMDTAGMHVLGLPDLQILFTRYDPTQVAALLASYVQYIFENGSVIMNGNTIQGLDETSKWQCTYADAIVEPKRYVLNIHGE